MGINRKEIAINKLMIRYNIDKKNKMSRVQNILIFFE